MSRSTDVVNIWLAGGAHIYSDAVKFWRKVYLARGKNADKLRATFIASRQVTAPPPHRTRKRDMPLHTTSTLGTPQIQNDPIDRVHARP